MTTKMTTEINRPLLINRPPFFRPPFFASTETVGEVLLAVVNLNVRALTLYVLFLGAMGGGVPARADLIKQSTTYTRTVLMTSSSDHITGATGLTLTIVASKAGGTPAAITPVVTEVGNGRYALALTATHTGTLGALDLTITATGADPSDTHDQIIPADFGDVATAAAQATGANNGEATNGANISALSAKIGSPSGASIDADILSRLAANAYTALPADFLSTGEQASLATAAANTPAATVAALLAGALITVPGTGTTTGTSEVLTYKQEQALIASISLGAASTTTPTASGSATVTYYLLGQPKTSGNIVAVSTPTFDANKVISGRTFLIQQPFPAVN